MTAISTSPRRIASSLDFLWLALVLMLVLGIAYLLPISPEDYWWYVRVGGDTVRAGAVPAVDTLSFTQAGRPVIYPAWLAAVSFWAILKVGGLTLTALVRGLALAGFAACTWFACREMGAGPRLASGLTLLSALAGSANWAMRPQVLVYPLFGLALWLLIRWHQGKRSPLWLLPLISLLWINLHGSFILLFLLGGLALLAGRGNRRALALALAAAFLASWINPYGPRLWLGALEMINDPSIQQFSREWRPPVNTGWQMNLFFAWLILFVPLVGFSPRRLGWLEWLWFLSLGWLAFIGLRYVIWFLGLLAPLSAALLAPLLAGRFARSSSMTIPALNLAFGALMLAAPLGLLPSVRQAWWTQAPPTLSENTPVAAAQWLKDHPGLPGPLWSEIAFASYLANALPERPVWINTNFSLFPPEQWQKYIQVNDAAPGWQEVLQQEGLGLLLVNRAAQPRLVQALERSPDWALQYEDPAARLYSKR